MKKCRIVYLVIVVLSGLILSSCNVFSTRKAEDPNKRVDWNSFQTTPVKTLENLQYSYNYRENVYNYSSLFFEDFRFYFDSQDANDFNIPSSWSKSAEIDMLLNTYQRIDSGSSMQLVLSTIPDQSDNIQANQAWLYRTYELTVRHSIENMPELFIGKFRLFLIKEQSGFWKIKEWNDYRTTSPYTWGRMKNAFSL